MPRPHALLLSSGFLAFGSQTGFLAGVQQAGLPVSVIGGTSSGALAASLWVAGMPARQILDALASRSPLSMLAPNPRFWRGLMRLDAVVDWLRDHLPPRFEDLDRPFAVGVADGHGGHRWLRSGPLPEAVAASCAMPYVFAPVAVEGRSYADGGAVDRTGLVPFRAMCADLPILMHWVERSHGAQDPEPAGDLRVVRSPRSGATFWNLGPVHERFVETRDRTSALLRALS